MLEKELERVGIPTVQICTIIPIAETVGANRIVKAVAIPTPVGAPNLPSDEEKALRTSIIEKSLEAISRKVEGHLVIE